MVLVRKWRSRGYVAWVLCYIGWFSPISKGLVSVEQLLDTMTKVQAGLSATT